MPFQEGRASLLSHSQKIRRGPRPNRINTGKTEPLRAQMSFSSSRLSTCGIPKPFPVPFSKSPGDVGLKKPIPGFYPRPTESESLGVIWGICVFIKLSAKNKCLFLTRIGDFLTNISSADSCYSETSWLWSHGPAYDVQRVTISLGMPGPWGRGIPQNSVRLHSTWPFFFLVFSN